MEKNNNMYIKLLHKYLLFSISLAKQLIQSHAHRSPYPTISVEGGKETFLINVGAVSNKIYNLRIDLDAISSMRHLHNSRCQN